MVQIASENGYNRLVLGSCTSRIACHVISATVKVCLIYASAYLSFLLQKKDISYFGEWEHFHMLLYWYSNNRVIMILTPVVSDSK
jgi:hypothetical protein